jgi:hypothetical protein
MDGFIKFRRVGGVRVAAAGDGGFAGRRTEMAKTGLLERLHAVVADVK